MSGVVYAEHWLSSCLCGFWVEGAYVTSLPMKGLEAESLLSFPGRQHFSTCVGSPCFLPPAEAHEPRLYPKSCTITPLHNSLQRFPIKCDPNALPWPLRPSMTWSLGAPVTCHVLSCSEPLCRSPLLPPGTCVPEHSAWQAASHL